MRRFANAEVRVSVVALQRQAHLPAGVKELGVHNRDCERRIRPDVSGIVIPIGFRDGRLRLIIAL